MPGYEFNIEELAPVSQVRFIENAGIMFWYSGEVLDEEPGQIARDRYSEFADEYIARPLLKDAKTRNAFKDGGDEYCIRHINKRIAKFLLDKFDVEHETCPASDLELLNKKIDEFYKWFWQNRVSGDNKLFERFLRHLRHSRVKEDAPATWYTLKEAAAYSRTGVTKLRELIDSGKLRSYRLDDAKSKSTILIHRKDLDAVILFDRSAGLTKREQSRLIVYSK
jgi:excisionase family DNA binding protein